jgi:hypothetical protein
MAARWASVRAARFAATKIAGIGHSIHMRLVTYPDPACIILGWVRVVCRLSGYPRKNV